MNAFNSLVKPARVRLARPTKLMRRLTWRPPSGGAVAVAEQRNDAELRKHPSYDPTTGMFVLDRDHKVPDFTTSVRRRARQRRRQRPVGSPDAQTADGERARAAPAGR
jgi:hypothetical protein